jgi:hypothetical protein
MFRKRQIDDKIHRSILSWIFLKRKRLQHFMWFMFYDFDSMTSRTRIDVFFNIFVYIDSEILSFQQIKRVFMFEMSCIWIIMILLEKLFSEKFWKNILFFFNAINYFQCFISHSNRDQFLSEHSSTRFLRQHSSFDDSRFHIFCFALSMFFRQELYSLR